MYRCSVKNNSFKINFKFEFSVEQEPYKCFVVFDFNVRVFYFECWQVGVFCFLCEMYCLRFQARNFKTCVIGPYIELIYGCKRINISSIIYPKFLQPDHRKNENTIEFRRCLGYYFSLIVIALNVLNLLILKCHSLLFLIVLNLLRCYHPL